MRNKVAKKLRKLIYDDISYYWTRDYIRGRGKEIRVIGRRFMYQKAKKRFREDGFEETRKFVKLNLEKFNKLFHKTTVQENQNWSKKKGRIIIFR